MKLYAAITKLDREQRLVFGYASTEALDNQGEIVRKEALEAALPAYMRFANIREMHQPSAVGVAEEAEIDEKGFRIGARIVDDAAWRKVTEGVYKGFSIGGKVTQRDPAQKHVITGVDLLEVSLVDRPANPEAVIELYKGARPVFGIIDTGSRRKPVQIWDCGTASHQHLGKAEAARCIEGQILTRAAESGDKAPYGDVDYADPGFQPDGQKRYPLDTERHIRAAWHFIHQRSNAARYSADQFDQIRARIVAAWKAKIDPDGPPAAARPHKSARSAGLRKGLDDVARLAELVQELDWLRRSAEAEAQAEGDGSSVPDDLAASVADLSAVLRVMVAEETGELPEDDDAPTWPDSDLAAMAVRLVDLAKVGARHSKADLARVQSLHDTSVALGADCGGSANAEGTKGAVHGDLAKALAGQETTLAKLDQLAQHFAAFAEKYGVLIEAIANQPAPPPVARSAVAITKEQDGGGTARQAETVEDFVRRLDAMEEGQRVHELTKLALRFPRVVPLRPGTGTAPA